MQKSLFDFSLDRGLVRKRLRGLRRRLFATRNPVNEHRSGIGSEVQLIQVTPPGQRIFPRKPIKWLYI